MQFFSVLLHCSIFNMHILRQFQLYPKRKHRERNSGTDMQSKLAYMCQFILQYYRGLSALSRLTLRLKQLFFSAITTLDKQTPRMLNKYDRLHAILMLLAALVALSDQLNRNISRQVLFNSLFVSFFSDSARFSQSGGLKLADRYEPKLIVLVP